MWFEFNGENDLLGELYEFVEVTLINCDVCNLLCDFGSNGV